MLTRVATKLAGWVSDIGIEAFRRASGIAAVEEVHGPTRTVDPGIVDLAAGLHGLVAAALALR